MSEPTALKPQATPQIPAAAQAGANDAPKTPLTAQEVIQRASKVQQEASPAPNTEAPKVNVSLDDVKDPIARQLLEKKLAEANSAISKTFGEIGAEKSKHLQEIERLKSEATKGWTAQRLQEELRRQDFIQAAQTLQAQAAPQGWEGSHEEWSALSPQEKQQFQSIVANQQNMARQMEQMLQSQVDATLKTKYPDYDSKAIDDFLSRAGSLPPDQVRELVHKAINAERWAKQAYELAMQDKSVTFQEKLNGSAIPNGMNANLSDEKPTRQPGESTSKYLSRIGLWNLNRVRLTAQTQRK